MGRTCGRGRITMRNLTPEELKAYYECLAILSEQTDIKIWEEPINEEPPT